MPFIGKGVQDRHKRRHKQRAAFMRNMEPQGPKQEERLRLRTR